MNSETIPIIIGMGIVTYIPRWLPLFFLTKSNLSPWLVDWLDFIPAAILSALVMPAITTAGQPRCLDWTRPELWVSLPTLLFALKTRSLAGTVGLGMTLYWIATQFTFFRC
jgi:branched-subunit amino acid transport protein